MEHQVNEATIRQEKAAACYALARNSEHSNKLLVMFQVLAAHQSALARKALGVTE
jgi:hypothetical protein